MRVKVPMTLEVYEALKEICRLAEFDLPQYETVDEETTSPSQAVDTSLSGLNLLSQQPPTTQPQQLSQTIEVEPEQDLESTSQSSELIAAIVPGLREPSKNPEKSSWFCLDAKCKWAKDGPRAARGWLGFRDDGGLQAHMGICNFFVELRKDKKWVQKHYTKTTYKCGVCSKLFKSDLKFNEHFRSHSNKKIETTFSCMSRGCPKKYASADGMYKHMRSQHREECIRRCLLTKQFKPIVKVEKV